uniref:ATP synthase complex subunit 8 n=1 Tax=Caystrus obscurus TaxID=2575667 RepID=A0A4D6X0C8_9HEMI|nr:ATP synthase F0 subunit 8 [Caystrus obscurus]QCI09303.1 ATP synthase F0 subunit 8 [Caystrus obscurus]
MPQMSPMWWEFQFILFILLMILTTIMIYFIYFNSANYKSNNMKKKEQINWKW